MRPATGALALPLVRRDGAPHRVVVGLAVLVSAVALLPLGFIGAITIGIGWQEASALVFRGHVGELLVNTVLLEAIAVPLAIALAVTQAWLTERTDLPGARVWAWLAVAPLAIPAFVHSYAWVSLIPSFHGLGGAVLLSVLAYAPFVYLPVSAQLRRLDPAIEDSAASLGLSPARVFVRAVLPQLRLSILGGALLIGLHLLAEFGLFAIIRFDTFTTAILDQFQSTYNGAAAYMLALVLVLCCLVLLWLDAVLRGRARFARVGSGVARNATRLALGRWTLLALAVPVLTTAGAVGVPLVTLLRWLWVGGAGAWTADVAGALGQTIAYAIGGAVLTTLAAGPLAWLSVRAPGRLSKALEVCHYYVGSLPGVVIALALVAIAVRWMLPLYQTAATVLLAYVILFLPRALVSLRVSVAQAPVELEWAAMALGRSPAAAVRQVTARLAAPGIAASMALVGLGITTELTATLMLAPNGVNTLATEFWAYTSEIDYVAATPYAAMMIVFSLPLTLVLYAQSRKASGG